MLKGLTGFLNVHFEYCFPCAHLMTLVGITPKFIVIITHSILTYYVVPTGRSVTLATAASDSTSSCRSVILRCVVAVIGMLMSHRYCSQNVHYWLKLY